MSYFEVSSIKKYGYYQKIRPLVVLVVTRFHVNNEGFKVVKNGHDLK